MAHLATEIKDRYPERLILYDLPPLLSSDDFLVFLPHVDASLLVVQEGKTRAGEIQRSLELLGNHNLLGMVLNKSAEENLYPYY
jgi:Mrp family chromosome partitioning ATPase